MVRQWLGQAGLLLGMLLGVGSLSSCELAEDTVGTDLPVLTSSGTIYVDTLTVRTSTVLVDSVPTSTSSYLMVGQYTDARLGTITARSYLRLGLSGAFTPEANAQFDSLTLVLPTDTYRYGDTTQVQHLQVHRLREALRPATTYYAFSSRAYDAAPLGSRAFRARAKTSSLSIRLDDALGRELLQAAAHRQLSTDDELDARLPGLALVPGAPDDAALLRLLATSSGMVAQLYYHYPSTSDEGQRYDFTATAGNRHFYQVQADRRSSLLSSLTATRQAVPSARTAAEAYVEGALGLQTKVEVPYLLNLNELGGVWVVNSATLTLETVTGTENRYLPPPAVLTAQLTNRGNQSGAFLTTADATAALTASYTRTISSRTNLEQGSYTFALQPYYEAVLKRQTPNDGLLLAPTSLDTPERVVLGGQGHATNPLKLGIYLTKMQ